MACAHLLFRLSHPFVLFERPNTFANKTIEHFGHYQHHHHQCHWRYSIKWAFPYVLISRLSTLVHFGCFVRFNGHILTRITLQNKSIFIYNIHLCLFQRPANCYNCHRIDRPISSNITSPHFCLHLSPQNSCSYDECECLFCSIWILYVSFIQRRRDFG